jgi:hypothetical protein
MDRQTDDAGAYEGSELVARLRQAVERSHAACDIARCAVERAWQAIRGAEKGVHRAGRTASLAVRTHRLCLRLRFKAAA